MAKLAKSGIGVLLVNLGTPNSPQKGDVRKYLKEFLLDERVIDINPIGRNLLVRGAILPFRAKSSGKLYEQLWTEEGSPLKIHGFELTQKLQAALGERFIVELAMRYQNPCIQDALDKLLNQQVSSLIIVPLFPQYASATTGSVHQEVMTVLANRLVIPEVKFINSYYDHPKLIEAFLAKAQEHDINSYDHVLFSYHGLPKRQLTKSDNGNCCFQSEDCCYNIDDANQHCYSAQCYATTKALVKALKLPLQKYSTCFQSRLGKEPWLEPYTSEILKKRYAAGDRRILVFCPAFVADCLETTIEISVEYAEEFEEMGGEHLQLVEGLNANPVWVNSLKSIILEHC